MTPNETLRRSQTDTPGLFDGRVMICDGAMGTMLNAAGFPLNGALCELSLSRPEVVAAVHQAYIDAGAEVIETNSFLASRTQLSHHGLEGRVREINLAAARVARDAAAAASDNPRLGTAGAASSRLVRAWWAYSQQPRSIREDDRRYGGWTLTDAWNEHLRLRRDVTPPR